MSDDPVALIATSVAKRYGRRLLFRDVNLRLEGGTTLAITGPNGSGKSTLLRILGGLLSPSAGTVTLLEGGHAVARQVHPLHVGIVAPYVSPYEPLSASENLHFIARLRGLNDARRRIDGILEDVGLADRANDRVATFSSGMVQRLRLAAAVLPSPRLLLLDEPSITLDADGMTILRHTISRAATDGSIVILATNVPSEAEQCDAVCSIDALR